MRDPQRVELAARTMARALLAGESDRDGLLARAVVALAGEPAWLAPLIDELAAPLQALWPYLDIDTLAARLQAHPRFEHACISAWPPQVRRFILRPLHMLPSPLGLHEWPRPALPTFDALAQWLQLEPRTLEWLAGPTARWPAAGLAQHHYRCLLQPKRSGSLRLIEAPRARLKAAQRRLLEGLLQLVPVHDAAHGFVPGRSVVTHARLHAGQPVVLRFDLRDFFTSIRASRIHALWRTLGYPLPIARALTTLTTTHTPLAVRQRLREDGSLDWQAARRLASPHLPQGAPSSPALSNLCAFGLDLRLDALARSLGGRYSRYADDLVLSGPRLLAQRRDPLQALVAAIALEEGFALNHRKTHCLSQGRRQLVTGIVVNQGLNTPREQFDRLKAVLHQCVLHGPASQNREGHADFRGHLRGQVAWLAQLNPARGAKLSALFERIDWARTR
jgi:RNA-directed DNA polymerase